MKINLPVYEEIDYQDPYLIFLSLQAKTDVLFFDSAFSLSTTEKQYSYIAFSPFKTVTIKNSKIIDNHEDFTAQPFSYLETLHKKYLCRKILDLPPFQGGIAGFFSYDLVHYLEKIPLPRFDFLNFPDLAVGFFDGVISFDHRQRRSWIVSTGFPMEDEKRVIHAKKRLDFFKTQIKFNQLPDSSDFSVNSPIQTAFQYDDYLQMVRRARQYIYQGDIFEVNLSQRFCTTVSADSHPVNLFSRIRKTNPAPFSAYASFKDWTIVSASPERFLSLTERNVESRPIKGTIKRGSTWLQDQELAKQLLQSQKDHAENVMIVDLMRNDLSRVCEDDSVAVEKLCNLETYATVHHLVSTIRAKLKEDETAFSLLKACFPGGSITGAPKIRAMEIISELEQSKRGPYCGCLGFISFNGDFDSSILIRSFYFNKKQLTFQTGGAIVWDSNPESEYEEVLIKAKALQEAILSYDSVNR